MLPDSLPDAGVLVRGSHTAMLHVTLAHVMRRTVEAPRLPARAQRPGVAHEAGGIQGEAQALLVCWSHVDDR